MANRDATCGLKLIGSLSGRMPSTMVCALLAADATATFVGDPVKLSGTADADGIPSIAQAAATDPIFGVITGFLPRVAARDALYRPASTLTYATVCVDPNALYEVQVDDDAYTFAITDVGLNADILVGSGSTATGASAVELDASTLANTAGLQLKVLGMVQRADNAVGDYAKVIVKINQHVLQYDVGNSGV